MSEPLYIRGTDEYGQPRAERIAVDGGQLREIMRELKFIGAALVVIWGTMIVMWYWR